MYVAREAGLFYRVVQRLLWLLFHAVTRMKVAGLENVPLSGPVVVCPNHLHMLDIPIAGMCVRRRTTILAADKWRVDAWFSRVHARRMLPEEIRLHDPQLRSFFNINTPEDLERALRVASLEEDD